MDTVQLRVQASSPLSYNRSFFCSSYSSLLISPRAYRVLRTSGAESSRVLRCWVVVRSSTHWTRNTIPMIVRTPTSNVRKHTFAHSPRMPHPRLVHNRNSCCFPNFSSSGLRVTRLHSMPSYPQQEHSPPQSLFLVISLPLSLSGLPCFRR